MGIDGGYVRNWFAKKHNFEVIVGKSTLSFGEDEEDQTPSSKRFGFVQTLDTKPKRRLYEVLHSQGLQMNQDDHLSLGWQRHASCAPARDEPEGHAYFGLVSSHDEADGVGAIRQRVGAV